MGIFFLLTQFVSADSSEIRAKLFLELINYYVMLKYIFKDKKY